MLSYKDMTFCREESCAFFDEFSCTRALTTGRKKAAAVWWGSNDAPISVFTETPDCFTAKEKEHE